MKAVLCKIIIALLMMSASASETIVDAQRRTSGSANGERNAAVRTVTIPVTLRLPERRAAQQELQYVDALTVFEDDEPQEILATRGAPRAPLTLAILIQDDLVSVGTEVRRLADFIRGLPQGSRVMVAYLRVGSLHVRQKFTNDLERAAGSLRIPIGSSNAAPYNPFALTRDALKRFESQPVGRRAVLLVSNGIDSSRGIENSAPSQSIDLQRAVSEAQRRSVAVYSIYAASAGNDYGGPLVGNGQGSLKRLSEETGGRAFFQGFTAPTSFQPFLRDIDTLLSRQFALTYLSTHAEKGFHRIRIVADLTEGEIYYPVGYTR